MADKLEISRDIAAPPEAVYAAISDVTRMGEWSEECHTCEWHDGFGCAFWNRPEAHLDPDVLAGMSWTSHLPPEVLDAGIERLRADLASGRWDERYGHLRSLGEADYGYKLVIAG